jgi:hypothetical protein
MQNTDTDRLRIWAMKDIIDEALARCQVMAECYDTVETKTLVDFFSVMSDASTKLSHLRWCDDASISKGVVVYKQIIQNL